MEAKRDGDIAAERGFVRLARLAVHDGVDGITLGRALDRPTLLNHDVLRSLIAARTLSS